MIVITKSLISRFAAYQKTEIKKPLFLYFLVMMLLLLLWFKLNIMIRQLMIYIWVFTMLRKNACHLFSSASTKWKMCDKCQA